MSDEHGDRPPGMDPGHWRRRDAVLAAGQALGPRATAAEILDLARWILVGDAGQPVVTDQVAPAIALVRSRPQNTGPTMTTVETAAYIGRPVGTLRQWRHRGVGPPSFRVGGLVAYRRTEVERWLADQELAEGAGDR